MGDILSKQDLFTHLILRAADHMKRVKASGDDLLSMNSEATMDSSVQSEAVSQQAKSGHEKFVVVFMRFVEFLILNCKSVQLKFQHVQDMFRLFVTEAATEVETREFFAFLTKHNTSSRDRKYLLDEKLRTQVFTKIMGNDESMNCLNLNLQAYECFKHLFIGVNCQEQLLTLIKEGPLQSLTNLASVREMNTGG